MVTYFYIMYISLVNDAWMKKPKPDLQRSEGTSLGFVSRDETEKAEVVILPLVDNIDLLFLCAQ